MAKKQDIKQSEARILIYLNNAAPYLRFTKLIGLKLGIDYGYLLRIIADMKTKEWISCERREQKVFYSITPRAPIDLSKIIVSGIVPEVPQQHTTEETLPLVE